MYVHPQFEKIFFLPLFRIIVVKNFDLLNGLLRQPNRYSIIYYNITFELL